ncbi:hypothetical protein TNCV_1314491 [Trichonephila clavipes]|nr:hypothetical protein TNCV_1314491 [Trichonephila clavipes]
MHNTTVQQRLTMVFPNVNPTIVILQAQAGFVSKYIAVLFRSPCPPFISPLAAQRPWFPVRGKQSNGRLANIPICCKRRRSVRENTE